MRNETPFTDLAPQDAPENEAPDRDVPGAALARSRTPAGAANRKSGPSLDHGDEAVRASRERAAAAVDARSTAESVALGTVAGSMVLGALYPREARAEKAKDAPDPRLEHARDDGTDRAERAAAPEAAHHPARDGIDPAPGTTPDPGQAARMPADARVPQEVLGAHVAPPAPADTSHHPQGAAADVVGAAAQNGGDAAEPARSAGADQVRTSGATVGSAAAEPAAHAATDAGEAAATGAARVAHDLMEQAASHATPGGLPPAVSLSDLAEHGGRVEAAVDPVSTLPAADAGAILQALPVPATETTETLKALAAHAGEGIVPAALDTAGSLARSVVEDGGGNGLARALDTPPQAEALVQHVAETAAALPDALHAAPIAPAVEALTETLTETLTGGLTGTLERGSAPTEVASSLVTTVSANSAHDVPVVGEALAPAREGAADLGDAVARTVSNLDTASDAVHGVTRDVLSGDAGAGHDGVATPPEVLERVVEAAPVHAADSVAAAVTHVLDAPSGVHDAVGVTSAVAAVHETVDQTADLLARPADGVLDGGNAADRAVEAAPGHGADPVGAVARVLDAPAHGESRADPSPIGKATELVEHADPKHASDDAVGRVSSAVDKVASLGSENDAHGKSASEGISLDKAPAEKGALGDDAGLAKAAPSLAASEHEPTKAVAEVKDTVASVADGHGSSTNGDGAGAAVGKAVGGTLDLGSSHQASSQSHDAPAAPAKAAADDAPKDVGGHAADVTHADVTHAAADAAAAAPVHVGFAGQSYVADVDSHEHGLASANGMLHGLV